MTQTPMVTLSARTFPSITTIAAAPSSFPDPYTRIRGDSARLKAGRERGDASPRN
uniref:Similar to Histidine acid phosphatase n=1 Tax=Arundo donax TaxID=35708 RepID=A0A0A9EBE6_ARUDO